MKKSLVIIDGYSGAGKSTALKLLKKLFKKPFIEVKKYSTRKRRINEDASDQRLVSVEAFHALNLDYFHCRGEGHDYYGFSKRMLDEAFMEVDHVFMTMADYFFTDVKKGFSNYVNIITVLIDAEKETIKNRILNDSISDKEKEKRIRRMKTRKITPEIYDEMIFNDKTLHDLEIAINSKIISKLY